MYFSRLPTYHPEKAFTSVPELPTPSATNFNGCIKQEGNYTTTDLGVDGVELLSQICKKTAFAIKRISGAQNPKQNNGFCEMILVRINFRTFRINI